MQPAIQETLASRDRSAQRRRTRRAILAAAVELMQQGETPTVNRVAEVADVSRRTVYLYYPSQEQLLTEAAMDSVRAGVEHALEVAATDDIWARVDTLVEATLQSCIDSEVQLRTLIRLSIERRQEEPQQGEATAAPLRGGRRVEWIETALEPVRERLGEARFARLVSGLAMVVGSKRCSCCATSAGWIATRCLRHRVGPPGLWFGTRWRRPVRPNR